MVQMAFAYVWALNNTYLKRHHKETTVLSNHSFLTVLWENPKNTESQMSPFLVEKNQRCYKFYFLTYYLHFKLIFYLFSATSEYMHKHIQHKSQITASQYRQAI